MLKWAIQKQMLTGEVFAFNDIPGTGPLDDGARMAFWRSLSFDKENLTLLGRDTDAFARWRELQACLLAQPADRLVIWAGSDGNDYVFIRMACHWIERIPVNVGRWQVPPIMGYHSIILYSSEALAPLINEAVLLPAAERSKLAREFEDTHPDLN